MAPAPDKVATETAPLRAALLAQLGGSAGVIALLFLLSRLTSADFSQIPLILALLQGGIAAMIALKQPVPRWWLPIHLFFVPLVVAVQRLDIPPGWFLTGFVLLLLVFWRTDRGRIPLYLTNRHTTDALAQLLPSTPCRMLDIGCGDGGLLCQLARIRPDCSFVGIEHAPLPWLLAALRSRSLPNVSIRYGDFWVEPLGDYDLIYAFLSPVPMSRLWVKACMEMRGTALLVSNSFPIPGVACLRMQSVDDRRKTHLYLYLPDKAGESAAIPAIPALADQQ